ncbi:MAG: anthranilate phosphoribosyltransferase [bacterium]
MLSQIISKLEQNKTLSGQDCFNLQKELLSGNFQKNQLIEIFRLLDDTRLDKDQLLGFIQASKEKTLAILTKLETLDIVGTGGDGLNTFNISTVTSFVVASLGVAVAKHGNKAATSLCGSADVLQELGANIELSPAQAQQVLEKTGFVFLFAKSFNPAFRFVAEARKEYGKKTYFNILGPLLNPASPKFLLLGLSDFSKARLMADVLINSGVKKAWIVQSDSGMDEISPFGQTKVLEIGVGSKLQTKFKEFLILPGEYSFSGFTQQDIQGGDKTTNAEIMTNILQGKGSPAQNATVILNAAAALTIAGRVENYQEGIALAQQSLESSMAWDKFVEFRDLSKLV